MGCSLELWAESSSDRVVVNYCCFIIEIQYMLCISMCYFALIFDILNRKEINFGKTFLTEGRKEGNCKDFSLRKQWRCSTFSYDALQSNKRHLNGFDI